LDYYNIASEKCKNGINTTHTDQQTSDSSWKGNLFIKILKWVLITMLILWVIFVILIIIFAIRAKKIQSQQEETEES
jgi:cell division protein FtsX